MHIFHLDTSQMTPEEQWEARLHEAAERYKLKLKKKKDARHSKSAKKHKLASPEAQEWVKRQRAELDKLRTSQATPLFSVSEPWKLNK